MKTLELQTTWLLILILKLALNGLTQVVFRCFTGTEKGFVIIFENFPTFKDPNGNTIISALPSSHFWKRFSAEQPITVELVRRVLLFSHSHWLWGFECEILKTQDLPFTVLEES